MRYVLIPLAVLVLVGCASRERNIPPGAVVVADSTGGKGPDVFSVCDDKGNQVLLTKDQRGPIYAIAGGCKPPSPPTELKAQAPVPPITIQWPQPFLVEIVGHGAAETLRERIVVELQPVQTAPTTPPPPVFSTTPACPACPAPGPARPLQAPKPGAKVTLDPNTSSADDLERLPGITAKSAQAIINGRPYRTLRELVEKRVLTESEAQAATPYLVIR